MKTQIFKTYAEFINRDNVEINGVNPAFAANNPNFEEKNITNKGCSDCSGCSGSINVKNNNTILVVPKIANYIQQF